MRVRLSTKVRGLVFVVFFAAVGSIILMVSRAASVFVSLDPEQGTVAAPAVIINDIDASGGGAVQFGAGVPGAVGDFSDFYPNLELLRTHYLTGFNYVGSNPAWAVLWFEAEADGRYKMYNSNPAAPEVESKCHWDQFEWQADKLVYSRTRHLCNGADNDIQYPEGITYLPRSWDGLAPWQSSGQTTANYYENGQFKCGGVNAWTAEIIGRVTLSAGVEATHARSTQTTTWSSGPGSSSGCAPGQTSRYQENLYFVTDLPKNGNPSPGLKRSVGGSLDFYDQRGWDFDVWMDSWMILL